jgi:hypothetical protein
MLAQVLEKIAPDMLYTSSDGTWANVIFEEAGFVKCDEYYEYTLYTLENADAIKKFREERNTLLDQSDKYMVPDYPNILELDIQNWVDYRQALRNLPTTARPTLDEDGKLKDVVWPTVPTLSF